MVLTSKHWKSISLHLSFKNSSNFSIHNNPEKENTLKTSCTDYMRNLSPEEKWSERQSMTVSTAWFIKLSSLMVPQSSSISWPVLSLVLLFLWERSISSSSRMSSSHFIRFKPVIFSINTWWDAQCFSWPRIHHSDCSCLMAWSSIGHSPTLPKRSCSFQNWLKFLKLVRYKSLSLTFLRSLSDLLNVFQDFIFKLLIVLCAFSRMIISLTFWKLTSLTLSHCWFPLFVTWQKLTGIKFCKNHWMHWNQFWKKSIQQCSKRLFKRKIRINFM